MTSQEILQSDYLDLIFADRNKSYGGYELRTHYAGRMRAALLSVFGAVALLCGYVFLTGKSAPAVVSSTPAYRPDTLAAFTNPVIEKPKAESGAAAKATDAPGINEVPEVVANDSVEIIEDEPVVAKVATSITGTGTGTAAIGVSGAGGTGNGTGKGDGSGSGDETVGGSKPETPFTYTEIPPQFDGDVNAFLASRIRYPEPAREAGIEGRVVLRFVVAGSGDISDVQVVRSVSSVLDAEAIRVVKSMPRWKPGMQNGRAVPVYFSLPITFSLQ